jgi:hypothetical protein
LYNEAGNEDNVQFAFVFKMQQLSRQKNENLVAGATAESQNIMTPCKHY